MNTTERVEGRLAARSYLPGDPLPTVGSLCLVSGANCDIESDQHRAYSWRRVIGYSAGDVFVCLQTRDCWPTVERLDNCWFAEVPTPRPTARDDEGFTASAQQGKPGNCLMAQVFGLDGQSVAYFDPTDDEVVATERACLTAAALNEACARDQAKSATVPAEPGEALGLALRFHEVYERLAPSFGYETRQDTREFDPASKNGRLMVAVCGEILASAATSEALTRYRPTFATGHTGLLHEDPAGEWVRFADVSAALATQAPAPSAQAVAPVAYRILERGEPIEATDEFLAEDAMTWVRLDAHPNSAGLFVGMGHAPGVLRPARRPLQASELPAADRRRHLTAEDCERLKPKSSEEAICFLKRVGILTEDGGLSPNYYSAEEIEAHARSATVVPQEPASALKLPKLDGHEVSPGITLVGEPTPIEGTDRLRCLANVGSALGLVELRLRFVAVTVEGGAS